MALDDNGRPSDAALLNAMKQDMDAQLSRLNDNRIYLIATVTELQAEVADLRSKLINALADRAGEPVEP